MAGPRGTGTSRPRGWIAAATIGAVLVLSATAGAEEASPTRTEYVTQLESVCKPDALETQQTMKGVRDDVSAGRIGVAAGKFAKASEIFGGTIRRISAEPRPPADEARLEKWFGYLDKQESYLKQITAELQASHTVKAQRLTARFIHNGNLANNVVLAFGFNYCSFKFSRYG
jgi:hypothetical protein